MVLLPTKDHTYVDTYDIDGARIIGNAAWKRTCECGWTIKATGDLTVLLLETAYQTHILSLIAYRLDLIEAGPKMLGKDPHRD